MNDYIPDSNGDDDVSLFLIHIILEGRRCYIPEIYINYSTRIIRQSCVRFVSFFFYKARVNNSLNYFINIPDHRFRLPSLSLCYWYFFSTRKTYYLYAISSLLFDRQSVVDEYINNNERIQ